jgi:hypothetical protein
MNRKKPKMGRPPVDPAKKRGVVTTFKLTKQERTQLEQDAKRQGMTVSAYIVFCWQQQKAKA